MTESETISKRQLSDVVAAAELWKLYEFNDIEVEDDNGNLIEGAEAQADLIKSERLLIKAIMRGDLVISESANGAVTLTQHLGRSTVDSPLVYHEADGSLALSASKNGIKFDDFGGKKLATVASLTKRPLSDMISLKGRDLKIAVRLGQLFLIT